DGGPATTRLQASEHSLRRTIHAAGLEGDTTFAVGTVGSDFDTDALIEPGRVEICRLRVVLLGALQCRALAALAENHLCRMTALGRREIESCVHWAEEKLVIRVRHQLQLRLRPNLNIEMTAVRRHADVQVLAGVLAWKTIDQF